MKRFEEPIVEVIELCLMDVITASGGPNDENAGAEDEF